MFEQLSDDAPDSDIERTARDLKKLQWEPLLLLSAPNFIHWKKQDMIEEFNKITHLREDSSLFAHINEMEIEDTVEKHLGMLIYYYEILCELRSGDAEAWDLIHELYEDD